MYVLFILLSYVEIFNVLVWAFVQLCPCPCFAPVLSLVVPVLSLVVPVLSLAVPVLSLAVPVLSLAAPLFPLCH